MAGNNTFPVSLVIKAVDDATAPLQRIGEKMKWLAKGLASVGSTMTLAITTPLLALGGASAMAFADFEKAMANVSTLVDTSKESLDDMGKEVLSISRRTPVALADLTEALYEARSAGVSAADQFKVLEGSARLAVVGLGSTKEAMDLVTSSINAFGLQGAEAERVYNLIFQATNTGKTTISQLAQGFGGVAGTVASAGVKLDEYLASVAALTTTGLPAAEAHTQLKAVIAGLTRQTDLTRAVFQRLAAKDLKDLIAKSGGLVPALDRIKVVLKGNDTAMLQLLGSTEALNATIGLTGRQGEPFRQTLEVMRTGADGVTAAFDKQNRTSAATMQRLQNALQAVAISIGRVVVPVLEQLVPMLERAATWWEGLGSEGQKSIVVMAGAAAAIGPTITVLGHLAVAFKAVHAAVLFASSWGQYLWMMRASIMASLVPSLGAASAAVWSFTVALLANPITWIVIAVVALGAAVYQIYKNWGPLKEFFLETWEAVWEAIGPTVTKIWDLFRKWTVLGLIIDNWRPIVDFFTELWDTLVPLFETAWEKIAPIVDKLVDVSFMPLDLLMKGGELLFGGDESRPSLGAASALPAVPQSTEARVQVDFANLPRGARVSTAPSSTAPVDVLMGYSMVTP